MVSMSANHITSHFRLFHLRSRCPFLLTCNHIPASAKFISLSCSQYQLQTVRWNDLQTSLPLYTTAVPFTSMSIRQETSENVHTPDSNHSSIVVMPSRHPECMASLGDLPSCRGQLNQHPSHIPCNPNSSSPQAVISAFSSRSLTLQGPSTSDMPQLPC